MIKIWSAVDLKHSWLLHVTYLHTYLLVSSKCLHPSSYPTTCMSSSVLASTAAAESDRSNADGNYSVYSLLLCMCSQCDALLRVAYWLR